MSLTTFLKNNKDVRERFRQEFKKPRFSERKDILAPPLSRRYSLVGTAFDYLMRFYLKFLNPDAVSRQWIAEYVIDPRMSRLFPDVVVDDTGKVLSYTETNLTKKARQIIEQAKVIYGNYLLSGEISDELIASTIRLAQLDPFYRSGRLDENVGIVYKEDVTDLRNLISNVPPDLFKADELCLLNPTFGMASKLVSGADADLVVDDTLIEIKTTKNLELRRTVFDQLLGYYVLHEISGVDELRPKPEIRKVAIYFSRHAFLYVLDLQEIINQSTFPDFMNWFKSRASREYEQELSKR